MVKPTIKLKGNYAHAIENSPHFAGEFSIVQNLIKERNELMIDVMSLNLNIDTKGELDKIYQEYKGQIDKAYESLEFSRKMVE